MISALIIYTQFFTRIPIRKEVDFNVMSTGIKWISLFGFLIGCLTGAIFTFSTLFLPLPICWIIAFIVDILLTSGFHLDALADTADGLFSSRKKERMLEIMKDSRVGSNGVIALIIYFLMMYASIQHLSLALWQHILLVVYLSGIGKAGLALQVIHMVYARGENGLGHIFCGTKTTDVLFAQILPLLVAGLGFGIKGIIGYSLVFVMSFLYRRFVYSKINGHTGDTIGAYVEISHVLFLMGLLLQW